MLRKVSTQPAQIISISTVFFLSLAVNANHSYGGFLGNSIRLQLVTTGYPTLTADAVVGDLVEFSEIDEDFDDDDIPDINIDLTDDTIAFDFSDVRMFNGFIRADFNGFVFSDALDNIPDFVGVDIDPSGTLRLKPEDITFTSDEIRVNVSALRYNRSTTAKLNVMFEPPVPMLQPGDADQDLDFDQLDLVLVSQAGKYLSGQAATWGEGDWDGAPGGEPGNPPAGNGLFDQFDIIAANVAGVYLQGPYAAIKPSGTQDDGQTSLVYNSATGELAVDAAAGTELTSINVTSVDNKLLGSKPTVLDGAFDNFASDNVFKATFGGSFGSISFGNVLPAGLSETDLAADLSVVGSLAGGGDLGEVDLIYVPEPASAILLALAFVIGLIQIRPARS